jgi:hypothetical protein
MFFQNVDIYLRSTWNQNPEHRHPHCRENLKSHNMKSGHGRFLLKFSQIYACSRFRFRIKFKTMSPWTGDRPISRSLPTEDNKQYKSTTMHVAGFEHVIPVCLIGQTLRCHCDPTINFSLVVLNSSRTE